MGLRINTNIASQDVRNRLRKTGEKIADSIQQLASGERINKGADDAAGLALSTKLKAEITSLQQATRNANQGVAVVQVAEGGLEEISNMLVRLRELSIQSASDVLSNQDREFVDLEYKQLLEEIDRISNTTQFNGNKLLLGEVENLQFQVGAHNTSNDSINYNNGFIDASTSGIEISGTGVATRDEALETLSSVDAATQKVSLYRASLGSSQRRLQTAVNNLETQVLGLQSAKSIISDTDVAESTANLVSANIAKQAGISVLAQANFEKSDALKLIG